MSYMHLIGYDPAHGKHVLNQSGHLTLHNVGEKTIKDHNICPNIYDTHVSKIVI